MIENKKQYILIFDNKILNEYTKFYFKEHPKARISPIKAPPIHPSINKWMIMKRPQMNALKQKWGDFASFVIKKNELEGLNIDKCTIEYKYYFDSKRRQDMDNRVCKFINDSLVKMNVIADDCYQHLNPIVLYGAYDKDNPRMELVITVLEN